MGIPTLQGLQTALSGLLAGQEALDVVGQNIANAQTPGYTRQQAVLVTNPPITIPALSPNNGRGAILGTGVGVETIQRIHDIYVEEALRGATTAVGYASAEAQILEAVQRGLNEPSSAGLATALSNFWSAWNNLASAPTSLAAREAVIAAAKEVTTILHGLATNLQEAQANAKAALAAIVGEKGSVETIAKQVASLNGEIKLAVEAGQQPNELIDKREALLAQLAKLGTVVVRERPEGAINVSFAGAEKPIVEEATVNWPQTLGSAPGGEVGALLAFTAPGGRIAQLESRLNQVAETLAKTVNANQPEKPFFSFTAGAAAATISVAATAETIQTGPAGQAGNTEYARAIAGLRGGEAETLYIAYVAGIGKETEAAQSALARAEAVQGSLAKEEQTISGVSIDEEMTNMISLQRGYEASARVLTAMDQMLETLIEHTGVVGL